MPGCSVSIRSTANLLSTTESENDGNNDRLKDTEKNYYFLETWLVDCSRTF